MNHHRQALTVIATAVLLDAGLGLAYSAETPRLPWWHGLYCALATAVTVGGDIPPANTAGYAINALECALVVPLFAATFSLFTSGLAGMHVRASEERVKDHIADQLTSRRPPGTHEQRRQ